MALSLMAIGGLITLTLLISTVIAAFLVQKGKVKLSVHKWLGLLTLLSALGHGLYGLSFYL